MSKKVLQDENVDEVSVDTEADVTDDAAVNINAAGFIGEIVANAAEKALENSVEIAVEKAIGRVFGSALERFRSQRQGAVSGETGRENPDKRVDFSKLSYSELCAFLKNHPKTKIC